MPSNEIMSVEGQLVGMPLAGPESFSQQQLDYLKRALGVDETVLWEGTLGAVGVTSATLSETFTNFEQIEVWWAQQQTRTLVQRYYTKNLAQLFCTHGKFESANNYIYLFVAAWSINGTTATKQYCKYKSQDQWNTNTWTDANELCPCKSIGIHRIAGGN